eukprot:1979502-Amphidinium_carterae.1
MLVLDTMNSTPRPSLVPSVTYHEQILGCNIRTGSVMGKREERIVVKRLVRASTPVFAYGIRAYKEYDLIFKLGLYQLAFIIEKVTLISELLPIQIGSGSELRYWHTTRAHPFGVKQRYAKLIEMTKDRPNTN